MLSPVSHRHRPLASQLVQASSQVRRRRLVDHQVRLAVSLIALAMALLLALLSSPAAELPSQQAVDAPALKAKS
jgi:hypothetical protein